MEAEVLVQVGVITFNQKDYIRECLDGILMQKTNFKFEILINDDCSTDGTTEIIKEYEQKYPNIIKPVYQYENQFSKGKGILNNFILPRITSKYVAICEGDDYWTDSDKLQKQVDFLESHPDYSICFHPVKVIHDGFEFKKESYVFPNQEMVNKGFAFEILLNCNFIQTNSVMYRWRFNNLNIRDYFPENIMPGDWYSHLLHAKVGKIGYLPEVMSVYRRNPNGIWSDDLKSSEETRHLKYGIKELNFYWNVYKNIADSSTDYYNHRVLPRVEKILFIYLKNRNFEKAKTISKLYSNEYAYIFENNNALQYCDFFKANSKHRKYKKLFYTLLAVSIMLFVANILLILIQL